MALVPIVAAGAPVLLYGPGVRACGDSTGGASALRPGATLPQDTCVCVVDGRAFLLLAPGVIAQLRPGTGACLGNGGATLLARGGAVTLYAEGPGDSLPLEVSLEGAELRNAGAPLEVRAHGVMLHLLPGDVVRGGRVVAAGGGWLRQDRADGAYLARLVQDGLLPAPSFPFSFPSERPPVLRHAISGHGGVATYRGTTYSLAQVTYRVSFWRVGVAYDAWLAVDRRGRVYREAWDQWRDLVDHVREIRLFEPSDPLFVRFGHIDGVTLGKGLLVDSYTNAVFLPFDNRTGIHVKARAGAAAIQALGNDVARPRLFASSFRWPVSARGLLTVSFARDRDQYAAIPDRDGDGYPDEVDPAPRIPNAPDDSLILATAPVCLDSLGACPLHGGAISLEWRASRSARAQLDVGGEAAVLWGLGTGVSFPTVTLHTRHVTTEVGLDVQSPRFAPSVFGRTYELERARFIRQPDGTLALVSLVDRLQETEGWLSGWHHEVELRIGGDLAVGARYRNVARGLQRAKRLTLSLEAQHRRPFIRVRAFLEQRNVSRLLRERADGDLWGMELAVAPHELVRLRFRYRERCADANANGRIEAPEVSRSVTAHVTVDVARWWRALRSGRSQGREEVSGDGAVDEPADGVSPGEGRERRR